MLLFVLKFNSRVAFVNIPSSSRDAEVLSDVVIAGSQSRASERSVIPDMST